MVSTVSMMALGSAGICALLSLNFYRKYRLHLRIGGRLPTEYLRVGDYNGVPLALVFRYRTEEGNGWTEVEADVDEIYHYGQDYFLHGVGLPDRKGFVFKGNRIAHLRVRTDGRLLESVAALLGEVADQAALATQRITAGREAGAAGRR